MSKLNIDRMTASAAEALGWPYVSPGSNDRSGIDCSGLFVKMYRDQGARIYHGSNTIFREYCSETGELTSVDQLQVGMAVFKRKAWTDADRGNRWYGKEPGNLSHIGYVASVHPLRIIHASTGPMCVTTDDSIKKWAYWGKLKDVDYGTSPTPSPDPEPIFKKIMKVYAGNGKPVNLRYGPSLDKRILAEVPVGETVTVSQITGRWSRVAWNGRTGWMMSAFLVDPDTPIPEPSPEPSPDPDPDVPPGTKATVWAENGKPVKMRARPSTGCGSYDELPVGTEVEIVRYAENWCRVNHGIRKGWYIMTKFLSLG